MRFGTVTGRLYVGFQAALFMLTISWNQKDILNLQASISEQQYSTWGTLGVLVWFYCFLHQILYPG